MSLFGELSLMIGNKNVMIVPKSQSTNVAFTTTDGWTISGTYIQTTGPIVKIKAKINKGIDMRVIIPCSSPKDDFRCVLSPINRQNKEKDMISNPFYIKIFLPKDLSIEELRIEKTNF